MGTPRICLLVPLVIGWLCWWVLLGRVFVVLRRCFCRCLGCQIMGGRILCCLSLIKVCINISASLNSSTLDLGYFYYCYYYTRSLSSTTAPKSFNSLAKYSVKRFSSWLSTTPSIICMPSFLFGVFRMLMILRQVFSPFGSLVWVHFRSRILSVFILGVGFGPQSLCLFIGHCIF
jgi:hypothetical protein